MKGQILINGAIGEKVFLADIIQQVKRQQKATSWDCYINSPGGYVEAGEEIANYISKLPNLKTIGHNMVASIATVIFLAGKERVVEHGTIFMIHMPLIGGYQNANDMESNIPKLRALEDKFMDFYSSKTNLTRDELKPLLDTESVLSQDQLYDFGFTTEKKQKLVAVLNINNPKNDKMSKETKEKASRWDALAKLFGGNSAVAVVELKTATQDVITFPDIDELNEIEEGVRGLVNGETADGEFSVELEGEVKTLIFTDGTLTSILDVEEDLEGNDELEARIEMLADAMFSMKEESDKIKAKIEANEKLVNSLKGVSSSFDKKIAKLQNVSKDKKKSGEFKNSYLENYKK